MTPGLKLLRRLSGPSEGAFESPASHQDAGIAGLAPSPSTNPPAEPTPSKGPPTIPQGPQTSEVASGPAAAPPENPASSTGSLTNLKDLPASGVISNVTAGDLMPWICGSKESKLVICH